VRKSNLSVLSVVCLLPAMALLTACGDADQNKLSSPVAANVEPQKKGPGLNSEYLSGLWCHSYNEEGEQRIEENINWEFREGGKFYMQKSRHSAKIAHSGYWDIGNGGIKIKPIYGNTYHDANIISNDEFTINFFMNLHIQRGACK
jgi:hypothetical protein